MKRAVWNAMAVAMTALLVAIAWLSVRIERESTRDEAQPADVIVVLGAAEYRGRPSPVLKARLDHALELYRRGLAPQVLTTGGAGGDPVFTEGGVGRSYLMSRGVPSEAIIVETEGATTVESTAEATMETAAEAAAVAAIETTTVTEAEPDIRPPEVKPATIIRVVIR